MAGHTLTNARTCQPLYCPQKFSCPGTIFRLSAEASILPNAERACSEPNANVRKCFGTLSATSVVAAPNIPPTPSPNKNRQTKNSVAVCAKPDKPEKTVYAS